MKDKIEIDFTDWYGKEKGKLIIPKLISADFKIAIIHFLSELDDHDGMLQCRTGWGIDGDDWKEFCKLL